MWVFDTDGWNCASLLVLHSTHTLISHLPFLNLFVSLQLDITVSQLHEPMYNYQAAVKKNKAN